MSTAVKMWRVFRLLCTCWKLNLAGAMEFRLSFLLTSGTMLINDFVWIFFWGVFFNRFKVVNGWELNDVMMMWAVSAGGFGIMAVLFGNYNRIANMAATGQLDIYLTQPKPILLHLLASRMSISAIGDVSFGVIIYAVYGDVSVAGIMKFILALLISAAIFLFFIVIVNSLAFFIGNAEGLSFQLYNGLIALSTYPTDIFHGLARLMLFTLIPAGFISYMPIGFFRDAGTLFLLQALGMAVFLSLFGTWFFYKGLKRYSSGNMIAMRN